MPETSPLSLNDQLASRVRAFCVTMGLSQRKLCRLLKIDETHFSRFLSGHSNFSAETTLKILQLINLSPRELQFKFGNADRITAKIMHLSEKGKPMKLDGGNWTPGQQGKDPNAGASIIDDHDPDTTEAFLRDQIEIHKSAIQAISDYLVKAKANRGPTTEGPRHISDLRKAGPRGDLLSVTPAQMLAHLAKERENAETELATQKKINEEAKRDSPLKWNWQRSAKNHCSPPSRHGHYCHREQFPPRLFIAESLGFFNWLYGAGRTERSGGAE